MTQQDPYIRSNKTRRKPNSGHVTLQLVRLYQAQQYLIEYSHRVTLVYYA